MSSENKRIDLTTTTPDTNFGSLHVLQLIKNAQQQHGLRHENYQRYRSYCTRRIVRIRRSLKYTHIYKCFPNRTARFVPRPITAEQLTDSRFLEICIFEIERNWAFYKQLKLEHEQKRSRKIFHARQKLRRAVKCAKTLSLLLSENDQVDVVTRMEVNAYTKFVEALLRVELMQFKDAINLFDVSKSAYEEVDKSVKKPEINELYSQRNREICVLIGSCQGDATALLGGVNSLNLNFTDAALDETLADEPTTKKNILMKKKTVEPKHSRPIKPFFFDLALNFVDNPEEFKK